MDPIVWLILFIVLIAIEALTLGLTTIWLAGGALVALIASAFHASLWLQVGLFLLVSGLLVIFTRPIAAKYFNRDRVKTNADRLVGKNAIVTETIDNLQGSGSVKVSGQEWTARSDDEEVTIEKGTKVEVLEVRGVRLICRKAASAEK